MKTKCAILLVFALPLITEVTYAQEEATTAGPKVETSAKADNLLAANNSVAKYDYLLPSVTPSSERPNTKKSARIAARLNKANYKALRDFKQDYQDAGDVKWVNGANAISATFNRGNILTSVVYDKSGHRAHSMKIYTEENMPKDLKRQVAQTDYYNHQIKVIQQIQEMNRLFYIVHLEDPKYYTQLSVYNGNVDVYKVSPR